MTKDERLNQGQIKVVWGLFYIYKTVINREK